MLKKFISIILVCSLIMSANAVFSLATQNKTGNFSKNYTLTGNQATDIVAVAKAQLEKDQSTLGYSEMWCADFVYNCAKLAGISSDIIPYTGGVKDMYVAMINNGAKKTSSPVAGDLCFYLKTDGTYAHVSIVTDSNKNTIHGNVSWCSAGNSKRSHVCTRKVGVYENAMNQTALYVHPNYSNNANNTYTFNFSANGGTMGSDNKFTAKYGDDFEIINNTCTKVGYKFYGWNVKRNNDGKWYVVGEGWCSDTTISSNSYTRKLYSNGQVCTMDKSWINGISGDATYTFYAQWTPCSHTYDNASDTTCNECGFTRTQMFELDVNHICDGTYVTGHCTDYATYDVYINGTLVADDVSDYCSNLASGTEYEIKDIKTKDGKKYTGTTLGSLSGTLTANTELRMCFVTTVMLDVNHICDGTYTPGSCADYATYDVYINGTLVADDVSDYCDNLAIGSKYEIKDIKTKDGKKYTGITLGALSGTLTANTELRLNFISCADLGDEFTAMIYSSGTGLPLAVNTNTYYVCPETETGKDNQLWKFEKLSNGAYKISSVKYGNDGILDNQDFLGSGARVGMCTSNSSTAQQWWIYESNGAYSFSSVCHNECSLNFSDDSGLIILTSNLSINQQWRIVKLDDYRNDECTLVDYKVVSGHIYEMFLGRRTWASAEEFAESRYGHLMTVTSQSEENIVSEFLASNPAVVWLGGTDAGDEGNWRWVTGEKWSYSNWGPGEPNNTDGIEHYLFDTGNLWNDDIIARATVTGFIVEIEPNVDNTATYNGNTYAYYDGRLTWEEAAAYADSLGGHLATITSQGEQDTVTSILKGEAPHAWLGAKRVGNSEEWAWITGEEWNYSNWADGEPNNNGGNENFLITKTEKYWNDNVSVINYATGFVVEYEHKHSYTAMDTSSTYLKSAATCTSPAVYYYKCSACSAKGTSTYTYGSTASHSYNATWSKDSTYHWRTCTMCGTAVTDKAYHVYDSASDLTCNVCNYQRTHTHTWNSGTVTKAATCKYEGTKTYTCTGCGETKTETISALGHNMTKYPYTASTCTTKGHYTYYKCNRCKNIYVDAAGTHVTTVKAQTRKLVAHKIYKIAAKSATCTTNGNTTYYKCSVCSKRFLDAAATQETTLSAVTIKAKSHYWGSPKVTKAATCTTKGTKTYTCTRTGCGATKTATIATTAHKLTKTAGVAPTCTTKGYWTYYTCSVCGKVFSDAKGTKTTTVAGQVRKAKGHNLVKTAGVAPTCTKKGYWTYYTCSTCGKVFSDAKGTKTTTVAGQVRKATGHKLTKTAYKASTCTQQGNNAYYSCSVCNKVYIDSEGKRPTTAAAQARKLKAHTLTYVAATSNTYAYYECSVCGGKFTDSAGTVKYEESTTKVDFSYTVSDGKATITGIPSDTKGAIVIPATLGGYPVTSIGKEAFYDCTGLTSVTIGNNVTKIEPRAFEHCTALTSITIPNSVTNIRYNAFCDCTNLTSITIPASVTAIGNNAIPSSATLKVKSGSYAETYAKDNDYKYTIA